LGGLPIALGFHLATRGEGPRPWLAPWRAGFWTFALGFLLAIPIVNGVDPPGYLLITHVLFLLGTGLHTVGWLRLGRGPTSLALALLPPGLYGFLALTWGAAGSLKGRVVLFAFLFTLASAVAALGAWRGLGARSSPLRAATTAFFALHLTFWVVRSIHALLGFTGQGYYIATASAAAVEGTLYLGLLAILQWRVIHD
jgi:hypothetical protein